jgi:hypothetical protein
MANQINVVYLMECIKDIKEGRCNDAKNRKLYIKKNR